ncbi:MAG: hypothetical protein KJ811_05510, partial [Candidatus Margulisbacteria bacterium]|nr:hypothetical protein [Candidatus Margulisiibacteriota bacterium]
CEYSLNCGKQSPEKIFDFLKNIDLYYLDLSPGHKKFQLINSPILAIGTTIEVEETAGNQYVKHNYQVVKIIENMGKSS